MVEIAYLSSAGKMLIRRNVLFEFKTIQFRQLLYTVANSACVLLNREKENKDRLAIAIRSLKDRCVTIVSLTQVLV